MPPAKPAVGRVAVADPKTCVPERRGRAHGAGITPPVPGSSRGRRMPAIAGLVRAFA